MVYELKELTMTLLNNSAKKPKKLLKEAIEKYENTI
jgi:hypothetical protein